MISSLLKKANFGKMGATAGLTSSVVSGKRFTAGQASSGTRHFQQTARRLCCLVLITSLAPLAGCAMCDCPYDYAGPTYTPDSGMPPYGDYRAGSVLSGGGFVPSTTTYEPGRVTGDEPTPAAPLEEYDDTFDPPFDPTFDSQLTPTPTEPTDQPSDAPPLDTSPGGIPPL